jgi:hypothetical protein
MTDADMSGTEVMRAATALLAVVVNDRCALSLCSAREPVGSRRGAGSYRVHGQRSGIGYHSANL